MPIRLAAAGAFMVLVCADPIRASAQETQRPGPEGNWLIEWHDYPDEGQVTHAVATLGRRWEQFCDKDPSGGCRFFNRRVPGDSSWSLGYSIAPYEHGGGPQQLAVGRDGGLSIEWGYGTLGGWGGTSTLRQTGPDEIRGTWEYLDGGGREVWRRAKARVTHVVFKGVSHYGYSLDVRSDDSTARMSSTGTPRRPGRVDAIYDSGRGWGLNNDMRGNRPKFRVEIYGENLWGHHLIDVAGALDLEPLPEWRSYIHRDSSRTTGLPFQRIAVAGIEADVVIWPHAMPGEKELRIDGQSIPFDFIVQGYPGGQAASERSAETTSRPSKANPLIIAGAVAGVALANVVRRRRRRRLAPGDLRSDVDTAKDEFERLQSALRKQVERDLADVDEFDRQFNEKWVAAMEALGRYMTEYPKLLPGLAALTEATGDRELARKVAEWADVTLSAATMGQGIVRGVVGGAGRAGASATKGAPVLNPPPRWIKSVDDVAERRMGASAKRPRASRKGKPKSIDERPPAKTGRELALDWQNAKDEVLGMIEDVNTYALMENGGRVNCVNTAVATDACLAGSPAWARPSAEKLPGEFLKKNFKNYSEKQVANGVAGSMQISQAMEKAGPGARGLVSVEKIVEVTDITGAVREVSTWHVFNVVNHKGHVFFPDGQSGQMFKSWKKIGRVVWGRTN